MNSIDDTQITVTEIGDLTGDVSQDAFRSLLSAYTAEGYEQGYVRGARDVLATYPLLIEQFLNERQDVPGEVRRAVRALGTFVERHIQGKLDHAGFENGAGI